MTVETFEIVPTSGSAIRALGNAPFDPHAIKREFPILNEEIRGKRLVWLDNAATTQKPRAVIDRISYLGDAPAAGVQTERRVIPRIMTASTTGMVAVTVALTLFAGPLYNLCASIGAALPYPVSLTQLQDEVNDGN